MKFTVGFTIVRHYEVTIDVIGEGVEGLSRNEVHDLLWHGDANEELREMLNDLAVRNGHEIEREMHGCHDDPFRIDYMNTGDGKPLRWFVIEGNDDLLEKEDGYGS